MRLSRQRFCCWVGWWCLRRCARVSIKIWTMVCVMRQAWRSVNCRVTKAHRKSKPKAKTASTASWCDGLAGLQQSQASDRSCWGTSSQCAARAWVCFNFGRSGVYRTCARRRLGSSHALGNRNPGRAEKCPTCLVVRIAYFTLFGRWRGVSDCRPCA